MSLTVDTPRYPRDAPAGSKVRISWILVFRAYSNVTAVLHASRNNGWKSRAPRGLQGSRALNGFATEEERKRISAYPTAIGAARADILFLKHDSSIFRQSSNPVCGSWKSQASSPEHNQFHHEETTNRVG